MRHLAILLLVIGAARVTPAQKSTEYSACSEKAATQTAMNECAGAEAARADKELNRVYAEVLAKAAAVPEATDKVKAAERDWIAYRDAYVEAVYPAQDKAAEYGSMYALHVALLRAKLTEQQTAALRDIMKVYNGGPDAQ
jgi:uncharacterized protein YecT (DUF1311 family)